MQPLLQFARLEFSRDPLPRLVVAVVVVGGISLFGGRGSILWGVILGSLTFEVIRSGLNYLGANPYFYQLIGGIVIFIAMYAAAIKTGRSANNG